jgi:hypothetical protein
LARRCIRTLSLLTLTSALLAVPSVANAATLEIDDGFDDEHYYTADPGGKGKRR